MLDNQGQHLGYLSFEPAPGAVYDFDYSKIVQEINQYLDTDETKFLQHMRFWCRESLFFLSYFILRMPVNRPWIVERIKEVQACNHMTLDLWAREHWKSSVITYALNVQEILIDPNVRIGIFSHTRSIAKAFLRRIKQTFESNELLKALFPDILYQSPNSQSPKWSEDDGIIVNRTAVFQECTVEAWGLVDGQPTSKHFSILNYDDVVTRESVSTPEQINKVDECFRLSLNLGTVDGKRRVIGTTYHFSDQYEKLKTQGVWITRIYPAEDRDGNPVLMTEEQLAQKRIEFGTYVYNCQLLLNPVAKADQKFRYEWLQFYRKLPQDLVLVLLCDPSNSKKYKSTGSDFSVYWLWGLDTKGQKFLVDAERGRFTLTQRWLNLKRMVAKWPRIQRIGYEQYGMAADIQHFNEMMSEEGTYFSILEMGGNKLSKIDRILRLVPDFENHKIWLPEHLDKEYDGKIIDLIDVFINEEYLTFPFSRHDDMLDAASRIEDDMFEGLRPYDESDVYEDDNYWPSHLPVTGTNGRCVVTGY